MKNLKLILILAVIALASACKKTPEAPKIAGSWELTDVQYTKSAQIGDRTVEVTLTFNEDGTFSMSQILGDGRAREYSGNWALADDILSGTYSDGTSWGASYTVDIEGDTMSMTPVDEEAPETYVYTRIL